MTYKTGRPISGGNEKHRKVAREWYQRMSPEERRAYVQRRSKKAQREADARRLERDRQGRNAYHRSIPDKRPPKPDRCSKCGRKAPLQWHHQGSNDRWLCRACNNQEKPQK